MSADPELLEALASMDSIDRAEVIVDAIESGDPETIERVDAAVAELGDPLIRLDVLAEQRRRAGTGRRAA